MVVSPYLYFLLFLKKKCLREYTINKILFLLLNTFELKIIAIKPLTIAGQLLALHLAVSKLIPTELSWTQNTSNI